MRTLFGHGREAGGHLLLGHAQGPNGDALGPELWSNPPPLIQADWTNNGNSTYTLNTSTNGRRLGYGSGVIAQSTNYRISFTLSGVSTTGDAVLAINYGGTGSLEVTGISANGDYSYDVPANASADSSVEFRSVLTSGTIAATISNISIRQIL